MRTARATLLLCLSASAALAGCGKMDWWKKSDSADRPSPSADPNLAVSPQEADSLRSEIAALRSQVEELKVRDRQLTDRLKELRDLTDGYENQIKYLADLPAERDRYKAQAELLKVLVERLQEEIRALKGGGPAPATTPAVTPAGRPATGPAPSSAPAGE